MPDTADRTGTVEWIIQSAGALLKPLGSVLTADELRNLMFVDLGVAVPATALNQAGLTSALGAVATTAGALPDQVAALNTALNAQQVQAAVQAAESLIADVQNTVASLNKIVDGLNQLAGSLPGLTQAQVTQFTASLASRVVELLTIQYLDAYIVSRAWLLLLGLLDQRTIPVDADDPTQGDFVREELHLDRLPLLLKSPVDHAKNIYGWGDASFQAELFLERVQSVLSASRISAVLLPPATAGAAPSLDFLFFSLREDLESPPGLELDLKIPIADGFDYKFPVSSAFATEVSASGVFEAGLRVSLRPPATVTLLPVHATLNGSLGVALTGQNPDPTQPYVILGTTGGSRLEATSVSAGITLSAAMATGATSAKGDLLFAADITGGKLILDTTGKDSFLSSFLPAGKMEADFDLGISWSPATGLQFKGTAGLEIVLPVNASIGPIALQQIYFSSTIDTNTTGIPLEVSAAVSGQLGPIALAVDRVGFTAHMSLPKGGGNVGPFDFSLSFKPPQGLGLVVDAQAVVGGGFLCFDDQKAEYSGVLDLQIAEKIAVKAIGVVTTRLPDGSQGYSFVILVFAQGFVPIQLGLGFALTGIGGLLAINRTFDQDALRAGMTNHTLDSIMFPADPVRNAPQIISNLNKVFPPAVGHDLFGPMAQISWGTPTLVTVNLGLVLEFGARLRLLLLAQIVAILPTRDNGLLRLQMDAVGVLDFDRGTAALDAALHDSRLLNKFVLTGGMAMRMAWKGSRNFALAVGGLHPAYNPPPNFPKLDRIAISLSSGDNPRIRCEAYFALTSNTYQFGAKAELFASADGFSIHGDIGYDVLFQLDPFTFVADFEAQLQLLHGSSNLFSLGVSGELAGPRPLIVKAKATFSILWWDVSIDINATLVDGGPPPALDPVVVLPLLQAALADPGNWTGQLPAGQPPVATVRPGAGQPGGVALHPLGTLTVKQGVVPLDLQISRFGQTTPSGADLFTISGVSVGNQTETPQPVQDFFAPAQFLNLSDDEKLSRPSFEAMNAGVVFGSSDFKFTSNSGDWLEIPVIQFETIILDKDADVSRTSTSNGPGNLYQLTAKHLGIQAQFGAAALSSVRRTGTAKYRTTTIGKYAVAKEGWSVITTTDLTVQPLAGLPPKTAVSYSVAAQAMQKLADTNRAQAATLEILRLSEITAAVK